MPLRFMRKWINLNYCRKVTDHTRTHIFIYICETASGDWIQESGDYLDVIPATNEDENANTGDSFIVLFRLLFTGQCGGY